MAFPLAVTDSFARDPRREAQAREAARAWGLPFVERPRAGQGLEPLFGAVASALLVLGGDGWTLRDAEGELRFSPGMATLRIKRLAARVQQEDHVLRMGEIRPGDSVVDATLGLGADALVLAWAVGPSGRVVGLERSLPLFALVSEGVKAGLPFTGLAPLEVRLGGAQEHLAQMADGSCDCVFFDPMFERPTKAAPAFEVLRRYASHEPLLAAAVAEARRVARRWVVVKSGRFTRLLRNLGVPEVPTTRSARVAWGRVPALGR